MEWRDRAICRTEDPDLFFPVGNSGSVPTLIQTDEAKAVCRRCPVREQCLDWAVDAGPMDGIWGGTTAQERDRSGRRGGITPSRPRREVRSVVRGEMLE
ncbi:WhiB family transcriptional regulator [Streptomyces coerulescens]|uniref:Transcriptional regulator WhiB n=1 Tax=Streptomyces coerulescens TaxID=29304 RepID=A0ABW0C9N6_STRCD